MAERECDERCMYRAKDTYEADSDKRLNSGSASYGLHESSALGFFAVYECRLRLAYARRYEAQLFTEG